MSNNKLHIDNWIVKAEPDYYTMFIKAWIPLNAWYIVEYPDCNKKDTEIIKKLISDTNRIRIRIESMLTVANPDSERFCYNLARLHLELNNRNIQHKNETLSFSRMHLEEIDLDPVNDNDSYGNSYQVSKGEGHFRAMIVNAKMKKTFMNAPINPYSVASLIIHPQYVSLPTDKMREKIKLCFEKIDPNRPIDLVCKSKIKDDYIELENKTKTRFVNKPEIISKSVIKVIYALRNMLFHGEIDPSEINLGIYEHAYYVLKLIIKELK